MADQVPWVEAHVASCLCCGTELTEEGILTHRGAVIIWTRVVFSVAVALDTRERVSYANVTRVASE